MELSGLIFVALALVWAVVLIPKALRHHDEVARTRAVEDVSDGVRVVTRRASTPSAALAPPVEPAGADTQPGATARRSGRSAGRTAAQAAARRRRRVLLLLLVVAIGVGTAAGLGYLRPWAPVIPALLILGFLVVARMSVRRERARRARRAAAHRRTAEAVTPEAGTPETINTPATTTEVAEGSARAEAAAIAAPPAPGTTAEGLDARDDEVLRIVSGLDDTSSYSLQFGTSDTPVTANGSVWDPLPVHLPTYVGKPRATRSVRTIDLGSPDVSSSGHDAAASALVAEAATSTAVTGGGTEAVGEDQRAVGT